MGGTSSYINKSKPQVERHGVRHSELASSVGLCLTCQLINRLRMLQ